MPSPTAGLADSSRTAGVSVPKSVALGVAAVGPSSSILRKLPLPISRPPEVTLSPSASVMLCLTRRAPETEVRSDA